ncbi:DinB family protein [Shouchella sp. 1P09AA]|uniref:DinB family protein n=1 Tax=unclassified Shouchella TaxID=2893065 RepID=UPI0039A37CE6
MSAIRDLTLMIEEVKPLKDQEEAVLTEPISEGKWSLREIVAHLYKWDAYNTTQMVALMEDGAQLPAFPNHDSFNAAGVKELEGIPVYEIVNRFISQRASLIEALDAVDPQAHFTIGKGKRTFTAESFAKIFVHHDGEHLPQFHDQLGPESRS